MNDADAEAALLALGPNLEWAEGTDQWTENCGTYSIVYYPKQKPGHDYWILYRGKAAPYRGTLEIAKAACERHHAAGKWQGSR